MKLEMHVEVLVPDVQAWIISSTEGEDADGLGHFFSEVLFVYPRSVLFPP